MERTPSRREGYERVVAQYGRPLLVYVARLLGSASEAEDVVQDVFVKFAQLWKGPLEPDARMTAWLRTTAHNLAVDAMRASARRAELHRRGAEERFLTEAVLNLIIVSGSAEEILDRIAAFRPDPHAIDYYKEIERKEAK